MAMHCGFQLIKSLTTRVLYSIGESSRYAFIIAKIYMTAPADGFILQVTKL